MTKAIRRDNRTCRSMACFLLRAGNAGILVSPAKTGFPAQPLDVLSVPGEEDAYN